MASTNPRKTNHARRERLYRALLESEGVCWLCGGAIDPCLRGAYSVNPKTGKRALHPSAPVVDEVIPVKYGGSPYDRGNVHLAHNRCNLYRGDRVDIDNVTRELRGQAKRTSRGSVEASGVKPRHSQEW